MSEINSNIEKRKDSKASKVLLVLGIITLIISIALLSLFTVSLVDVINNGANLGSGMGLVLSIIFSLFPGFIISMLSIIFNVLAYRFYVKPKPVISLISLILSIIVSIAYIVEFIMIYAI